MRTTIDLPDTLARQAKLTAVHRGMKFKELVSRALEHEIGRRTVEPGAKSIRFPLVRSSKPGQYRLSPAKVHDILIREETAAYEAAERR
ncbi:MAG: hypothetical protein BWY59_02439 [Verrucomicrobia bacterium ADurb.Bin345]|nr:MAG: hypothetical protein BWY59_02439 [Verrucomicrobia bacterium ADurb.Bin345]